MRQREYHGMDVVVQVVLFIVVAIYIYIYICLKQQFCRLDET